MTKWAERILLWLQLALFLAICVWGIAEAVYAISQVLGFSPSRHLLFSMTGHFDNPGPFGGFIACTMAVAVGWLTGKRLNVNRCRLLDYAAAACFLTGCVVLPASMSRTAWVALAVSIVMALFQNENVHGWIRKRRWIVPASLVLVLFLSVAAMMLKFDSAAGRFHIWHMELRAVAENPLKGVGAGRGPWAYGQAQESFFRLHIGDVSPVTVNVAGCPEYAFNEYLGLAVEYGIPLALLFIVLIVSSVVILNRTRSPFASGTLAWAVFAFASYPLSVRQLCVFAAIMLMAVFLAGVRDSLTSSRRSLPVLTLWMAACLFCMVIFSMEGGVPWKIDRNAFRSVYAEGYELHREGLYAESSAVLEKGAQMSCDPMFEIIIGKNAEAMGDDIKAELMYEKAHYMVPSRLYPLVRLVRLYVRTGRDDEAESVAEMIVSMPVNPRHEGMVRLRTEMLSTLDSLRGK